jgi:hypothetical protein
MGELDAAVVLGDAQASDAVGGWASAWASWLLSL